jgi:hypothetical protein
MTELPKIVPLSEHSVCYKEFVSQNYIKMNDQWIKKEFTFPVLATNVCKPALHFNINTPFYSWFTSPLRRFFDLAVHNLLFICVDKEITDKFNQTFSNKDRSSTNDSIKFFFINKNSELLFKKLVNLAIVNNANERLILATTSIKGYIDCQFFIFNTTFSFPLSIGLTKGYADSGFYYIRNVRIIGKNNFDFNFVPVPANQNFDSLIMNNILSFFPPTYRTEYIRDIVNFSYTSCVKDFMEGRFGGYKNGKNGKNGKNNTSFREKYLKYKLKYLDLKKLIK